MDRTRVLSALWERLLRVAAAAVVLTGVSACSQEPIAKFSVTATTLGDWESYRDRLQPKFTVSADAMLASVLPITERSELKVVQQTSGRVSVQIPAAASAPDTPVVPAAPAASSLPGLSSLGTLSNDPLLQYHLANALFQEVQLLNSAMKDTAIPPTYNAYVLRLNLAVMPFRSDEAADVYATISFFDGLEDSNGQDVIPNPLTARPGPAPDKDHPHVHNNVHTRVIPMFVTDTIEAALRSKSRDQIRDLAAAFAAGPENVGVSGAAADRLEELATSLSRDYNTTFQVFRDSDNTILVKIGSVHSSTSGRSLLSRTFPVSVLLLVPKRLFDGCDSMLHPRIDVVAALTLRNPVDGTEIETPSLEDRLRSLLDSKLSELDHLTNDVDRLTTDARFKRREQAHKKTGDKSGSALLRADAAKLLLALDRNDYATFREVLHSGYPDMAVFPNHIWPLLVEAINESGFSATSVSIPCPKLVDFAALYEPNNQHPTVHAVLVDDGKAAIVDLTGFRNLPPASRLSVRLVMEKRGEMMQLPATKVQVADAGDSMKVQFQSVKSFKADVRSVMVEWLGYNQSGKPTESTMETNLFQKILVQYVEAKSEPDKPGYVLQTDAKAVIVDNAGNGTLAFTLKREERPLPTGLKVVAVRVDGAAINAVTLLPAGTVATAPQGGSTISFDATDTTNVNLTKDITVRAALTNLRGAQRVKLTLLFEKEPAGSELDLPVESP